MIMKMKVFFLGILFLCVACGRDSSESGKLMEQQNPCGEELQRGISTLSIDGSSESKDTTMPVDYGISDVSSSFSLNPQPLDIEFFSVNGNVVFRNTTFPLGDIPAAESKMVSETNDDMDLSSVPVL